MGLKKCKECSAEVSTQAKACPKCGAPAPTTSMGVKIGAVMIMMATCTVIAKSGGGSSSSSTAAASVAGASGPATKAATPAVAVSAMELWQAYDANEVAADNAYKGRTLLVTGTVASIDKDVFDNIVVHLKAPNEFMDTQATMEDSEKSRAASLQKGSKVAVSCTGGGRMIGSPMLKDCTFE